MNPNSLKIYKVVRYSIWHGERRYYDQVLYETPKHALSRVDTREYYESDIFAAKPFINSNDELELRWELLTPNQIEELREAVNAERLDKKTKRR